ncbi:polymorphic toxin type 44 domain-containing protein [Burkholderia dolosa]|jgi:hypothetical protein|uniref:polymorphic toxin type 44 domain-containing protein n=2 Tax=Burkholderia dolosa TaxID=152500 RepID=UPI001FC8B80D|nr:polymorphic toxin type 44 domain-containing protein [Burkholderia dolosa]
MPFSMPRHPSGVSLKENMRIARARRGPARIATAATYIWFYRQVRNRGPWDYKQKQREYADFGNFNYGATGYAAGIPEQTLLRAAGCAQMLAGTSLPEWGHCWERPPYGDDPGDQAWILKGIEHAKMHGY